MGGTWLALVSGFGGLRVKADGLHLHPRLPKDWESYSFPLRWRQSQLRVDVTATGCRLDVQTGGALTLWVYGQPVQVLSGQMVDVALPKE